MTEGQYNELILALEKCLNHLRKSDDHNSVTSIYISEPERLRRLAREMEVRDEDITFARLVYERNKK